MKLAVSNIAWEHAQFTEHLALIRALGCDGVELAPSCIWPEPVDVEAGERSRIARLIRSHDLELTGFHALLYTRPDLQLFKDRAGLRATTAYLRGLVRLCADMGGSLLVFGSPKNRVMYGRSESECFAWAADAFARAAHEGERAGVTICIEPLGPTETQFIRSSEEGMRLVRLVNHPRFALHLDAKAMVGAGEAIDAVCALYGDHIRHFHVGDPGLAPPGSTGVDHRPFGAALRRIGYRRYISIEMRRGFGPSREVIRTSIEYVRRCYLASSDVEHATP